MATQQDSRAMAAMVREEDLDDLKELQNELQGRIDTARGDGRIFMMEQYTRLFAIISADVKRIQARFTRQAIAANRREVKELKETNKQQRDSA